MTDIGGPSISVGPGEFFGRISDFDAKVNHEHALRSYYLDIRWTLVVSAFEALMNIQEQFVRRKFCGRLATEFGVSLSDNELDDAYTLRCGLVHSQAFLVQLANVPPPDKHIPLLRKAGAPIACDHSALFA